MRFKLAFAALAATVAFASPALAQTAATEPAEARGTILQRLTLVEDANLDFGTVLSSAAAGTVSIDSDSGVRSVTLGVSGVAINPGHRAQFTGYGDPNMQVNLSLSAPAFLVSGANAVGVSSMTFDSGGTTRVINATGAFQFGVGGTFAIAANQPAGLYTGVFTVTAQYP